MNSSMKPSRKLRHDWLITLSSSGYWKISFGRGRKPKPEARERVKEDTVGARTAKRDIRFIADEKTACSNP